MTPIEARMGSLPVRDPFSSLSVPRALSAWPCALATEAMRQDQLAE